MLNLLLTSSGVPLRAGSSKILRFLAFLGLVFPSSGVRLVRWPMLAPTIGALAPFWGYRFVRFIPQ